MVFTVEAKTFDNVPDRYSDNYAYNNAVSFMERGLEFFIFTNGDFDFNTRSNESRVRIRRNFKGQIRSIGNVHIRYNIRGNVTRIGTISIRYFRGRLTNVGDLRVRYNRWEYPVFYGSVRDFYYNNGVRFNVSFGDICDYNDAYFLRNDFIRNYAQFREDQNFYYYSANPNARIGKRSTILKRRKPVSVNNGRRKIADTHSRNSYRKPERETNTRNTEIKRTTRSSNTTFRNNSNRKPEVKNERRITRNKNDIKKATRSSNKTSGNSRNKSEVKTESKRNTRIKSNKN
jgi:hypothetical protein